MATSNERSAPWWESPDFVRRTRRRHAAERRFRLYGIVAIAVALLALVVLLSTIMAKGHSAWRQTVIALDIDYDRRLY
jgi:phosphate transport system permease protein